MKKLFLLLLILLPVHTFASESFECVKDGLVSSNIENLYYYKCGDYRVYLPTETEYRITYYNNNEDYNGSKISIMCGNADYVQIESRYTDYWVEYIIGEMPFREPIIKSGGPIENCICPKGQSFGADKKCYSHEALEQAEMAQKQAILAGSEEALRAKLELQKQQAEAEQARIAQENAETQSGIHAIALKNADIENQRLLIEELRKQNERLTQIVTGTLVSSFARNYSGSTNTGTLSGTGSKTPIELLRERFYANQKARLEAHYEKLRNIRAGFLKLQEQE